MITEEEIKNFLRQLPTSPNQDWAMYVGKNGLRGLIKEFYGGSYTFRQMLSFFRSGFAEKAGYGTYVVKTNPFK